MKCRMKSDVFEWLVKLMLITSLLIVTAFLFLVTGILALLGVKRVQRGTPPVPQQAIDEAKLTTQALKANGHHE